MHAGPGRGTDAVSAPRRWPVISALGVTQIFAWGCSYYLLTVLGPSIAAETGWPLPWIFGSLTAGMLAAGAVAPLAGRLIGRHGGRPVLAAAAVVPAAHRANIQRFAVLMAQGAAAPVTDTVERLLGRPARDVAALVAEALGKTA